MDKIDTTAARQALRAARAARRARLVAAHGEIGASLILAREALDRAQLAR